MFYFRRVHIASIVHDRDTPHIESASRFRVMCRSLVDGLFNAGTVDPCRPWGSIGQDLM